MSAHRVLLAHSQDWLGVSRLPALFARGGLATTLIGTAGSMVSRSRFVDEHIVAPADLDQFVALLRRVLETRGDDFGIVLLADDPLLDAVGAHAGEAWLDRCFPVDHRSPALELLRSKFRFVEAAARAGLPLPRSQVVPAKRAVDAANTFGYPVMIKRSSGSGGAGVRKASTARDVEQAIADFGDEEINVEEFVDGIVGVTEALYDHGRTVCSVSVEKRRRYPAPFGPSAVRVMLEPPGIARVVDGCGAMSGFHGFVAICWQYQPATGRIALLEMNPRPGSGMHLSPGPADIFAAGLRALVEGRSAAFRYEPVPAGRTYRMFPQDVQRALDERDVAALCAWFPGLPGARDLPWSDPAVLRAGTRMVYYEKFPAVARRISALRARFRSLHVVVAEERRGERADEPGH